MTSLTNKSLLGATLCKSTNKEVAKELGKERLGNLMRETKNGFQVLFEFVEEAVGDLELLWDAGLAADLQLEVSCCARGADGRGGRG